MYCCCPNCNGEDIRKFSVIYKSGVFDSQLSGEYVGLGGNWGYLQASSRKTSQLAKSCAPPRKFSFLYFFVAIAFAAAWCPLAEVGTGVVLGAVAIFIIFFFYCILGIVFALLKLNPSDFLPHSLVEWLAADIPSKAPFSIPIVLAFIGLILFAMLHYNRTTWVEEYRKWQSSYMCLRCGTKFTVS